MRKNLFFLFLTTFLALFLYNCSKTEDTPNNTGVNTQSATLREGAIDPFRSDKVHLRDGMLEFNDYRSYKEIYENLQTLSSNPELRQSIYEELGYNMSEDADINVTDQPILEKFENRFSFLSARKVEENHFFDFLRSGGEPNEFNQESFLYDSFLKAVLNQNNEVKIGSRIFKYLDEKRVAVILNSDFAALQNVRNTPIEELNDTYNVFIWNKYNPEDLAVELFEKDAAGNPIAFGALCFISFKIKEVNGSTFTFENTSLTENNCGFTWSFGDGTFFKGVNPPPHTYASGTLPADVLLSVSDKTCGCDKLGFHLIISKNSGTTPLCNPDFEVEVTEGNVVNVKALSSDPNATFTWDFGDGNTATGKTAQHFYSASGFNGFTISLMVSGASGACTSSKVISAGCGAKNGKEQEDKDMTISNRKWRLEGVIWSQNNALQNTLGSSSKSYRRWAGVWWQIKANKLWVSLEGDFFEQTDVASGTQCTLNNVPFLEETEDNSNYVARNIGNTKNVSFWDRQLKSTHKMRVGSTEWSIPELFLID